MPESKDATLLTPEQGRQLYDHIRAVEGLTSEKDDIQSDITERKTLCCSQLPINKDVLDFVLKRRKHNKGVVGNFDTMLELVEEAIAEVENERRDAHEIRDQIKTTIKVHEPVEVKDAF